MSLEKGMLLGFMLPGTVLILINTLFAMIGLKAISKKQQEAIANTIQTYLTQTVTTENTTTTNIKPKLSKSDKFLSTNTSLISLNCTPRRNQDECSKSALDIRRYKSCDDLDDQPIPEGTSWVANVSNNHCSNQLLDLKDMDSMKNLSYKIDLSSLSIDNLSWKTTEPEDMSDMRKCLNFALIMQPLFCVFWFMGVVALENSDQILPPFIFAFLWSHMVSSNTYDCHQFYNLSIKIQNVYILALVHICTVCLRPPVYSIRRMLHGRRRSQSFAARVKHGCSQPHKVYRYNTAIGDKSRSSEGKQGKSPSRLNQYNQQLGL